MNPPLSFEFFPPAAPEGVARLWQTAAALAPFGPQFVSVTYGAGGSTRALTHQIVTEMAAKHHWRVAAHLTCVGASKAETLAVAEAYAAAGIHDLVALRGDPPQGTGGFAPHPEGFAGSAELVAALAARGFRLQVGAYPERHPDAASEAADIAYLKRKFEAGASGAITQFFFEAETFLRFRDRAVAAGITAPLVPGILPITSWAGAQRFAARCGARVPLWLAQGFEVAARDGRAEMLALTHCTSLCERLIREGVPGLHFYTLNQAALTREVCRALGYAEVAAGAAEVAA